MDKTKKYTLLKAIFYYSFCNFVKFNCLLFTKLWLYIYIYITNVELLGYCSNFVAEVKFWISKENAKILPK